MFYGHRGSRNPFRSNNDGTIALASLLDSRPQSEAKMNYAFNEDHASIIHSKAVLDQYNAIINGFGQEKGTVAQQSGGYLQLLFSYNYPLERVRPQPLLVLQPVGKKREETIVYLNAKDSGRILGPFPAGDYLASFGALTALGEKYLPVTIKNNETSEMNYILRPDNIISGYVTTALKPENRTAGMPDGNITIQSITLKGAWIHRKLQILEDEDVDVSIGHSFKKNIFTKACSVNTIYFREKPERTVNKVMSLMQPGGKFVLVFEDVHQLEQRKLNRDIFRFYRRSDVRYLLENGAFSNGVSIESREKGKLSFHCAVATK